MLSLAWRYLNKAQVHKTYTKENWQRANAELAICTAGGMKATAYIICHYTFWTKTILVDFTLMASTLAAKPPNFAKE